VWHGTELEAVGLPHHVELLVLHDVRQVSESRGRARLAEDLVGRELHAPAPPQLARQLRPDANVYCVETQRNGQCRGEVCELIALHEGVKALRWSHALCRLAVVAAARELLGWLDQFLNPDYD